MLAFLLVELPLDYVLVLEFRSKRHSVIGYVVFFSAATGGMLGVAAVAGRTWTGGAIALYLLMAVPVFVQRIATRL